MMEDLLSNIEIAPREVKELLARDDKVLFVDVRERWEYDTAHDFETVNKVPAKGGAISAPGPTIVNGMLYIGSGYAVTGANSGNVLLAFSAE